MSYNISFRVPIIGNDGKQRYYEFGNCCRSKLSWNLREMIQASTKLPWLRGENNGLCKDVVPLIEKGLMEIEAFPDLYEQYQAPNGWGTIKDCRDFFKDIIKSWARFKKYYPELSEVTIFWIV